MLKMRRSETLASSIRSLSVELLSAAGEGTAGSYVLHPLPLYMVPTHVL